MTGGGEGEGRETEIPERLFRQSDDWKWIKAERRAERRRRIKARIAAALDRRRYAAYAAIAAPVLLLALAWLIGAGR